MQQGSSDLSEYVREVSSVQFVEKCILYLINIIRLNAFHLFLERLKACSLFSSVIILDLSLFYNFVI